MNHSNIETILVTGAAGFIGAALTQRLLQLPGGVRVVGLDSMNCVGILCADSSDIYLAKAVYYKSCSDCGTVSEDTFENGDIDADNHGDTEVRNVESATCTKDGYTGDVYCKDCDEMVTEGEIIPAGHDYGTAYATDSENHWKECGCGNVIEKEAHSMGEWQTGKEKKERSCSVCGYKEIQELPTDTTDSESPKTGDSSHVYIWYILLVLSCMGVVSVFIRKKQS